MYFLRNLKMRITRIFITLATVASICSCNSQKSSDATVDSAKGPEAETTKYSDLRMFELTGNVKSAECTTFYNVTAEGKDFKVDTAANARRTVSVYFDKLGNYVPSEHEIVKRDSLGRLTYWRDRRPNAAKVDPGVLRDTLAYTYENDYVLLSSGMGELALTVYDSENRIVGQYSKPDVDGVRMSAFNIYTKTDDQGNWTERTTVWVSNAPGKRPHVTYTTDSRIIEYY